MRWTAPFGVRRLDTAFLSSLIVGGEIVHDFNYTRQSGVKPPRSKAYDIPLRALIARDVDGLMMTGRCISGDFLAHSSYRVTGNAVAMGEAAGTVSALAARTGRLPHEAPWQEARRLIHKQPDTRAPQ